MISSLEVRVLWGIEVVRTPGRRQRRHREVGSEGSPRQSSGPEEHEPPTRLGSLAETPSVFAEFDEWLRRRLRQVRWKEWKRPAARRRNLIALGIPAGMAHQWANSRKGYWRLSGSAPVHRAMPNTSGPISVLWAWAIASGVFGNNGEPPDADPHVRWCGRGRSNTAPYPIP
jgi:hypothetical protein